MQGATVTRLLSKQARGWGARRLAVTHKGRELRLNVERIRAIMCRSVGNCKVAESRGDALWSEREEEVWLKF